MKKTSDQKYLFTLLIWIAARFSVLDYSLWKITPPLGSDIGYDSEVAIETSGDLRLVGTRAFPAFALSVT